MLFYYESLTGLSVTSDICLGNSGFKTQISISFFYSAFIVPVPVRIRDSCACNLEN